ALPGRFKVQATLDAQNLVEKIDAVAPNAVLGDLPVEIRYSEYKDFAGVKFPTRIRQTIGAYPALDLTVSDVQAHLAGDIAVPATIRPDRLAKSGKKGTVEGMRDKRVLTDGARIVELHNVAGNNHHAGVVMVYLPKEKLLVEADVYNPPAPNAPPPPTVNSNWVNLSDNIKRLNLTVDQ